MTRNLLINLGRVGLFFTLLVFASQSFAHQKKEALTKVLLNERTGNIEVMHRFLTHDVEHALKRLTGESNDVLLTAQAQQRFSDYAAAKFELAFTADPSTQSTDLELQAVGHELEGPFFWVYFEAPIPPVLTSFLVQQSSLQEIWPTQVNLVNIERDGHVQGLLFTKGSEVQQIAVP